MRLTDVSNGWRFVLAGTIAFVLFVVLIGLAHADGYVPLTLAQAHAYIDKTNAADPDEIAREIIKLDYIEHATPAGAQAELTAVLRGRDLILSWEPPYTTVMLPSLSPGGPPALLYHVDEPTLTLKNFAPPSQAGEVLLWKILAGVGTATGVLLGHALK